ncbi:MAG: AsmA-like C-terminal region-containing protein [bacterium]|nr:AsmA-like C-terminal region-containing protein [bacterium]
MSRIKAKISKILEVKLKILKFLSRVIVRILKVKLRLLKYLSIITLILVVLIAAAAALFVVFYPKEKLQEIIITEAEKTLQRKITIDEIDYSLKGIVLKNLKIHNGPTKESPVLAASDDAALGFSIRALLQKELNITQIYLKNLKINVVYDETGLSNIDKMMNQLTQTDKDEKEEESSQVIKTKISNIKLENAVISLKKAPRNVEGFNLATIEGDYTVNARIEFDDDENLLVSNCKIILPKKRGVIKPEVKIVVPDESKKKTLEITGDVSVEKASLLWIYTFAMVPQKPYHITSSEISNLKITPQGIEGSVKGSCTLVNSKKRAIVSGYCKVSMPNETVFLSNVNAKIDTSSAIIKSLYLSHTAYLLSFNIVNIDVHIGDVRPILDFLPAKLFGKIRGNLNYQKKMYNGSVSLVNLGFDTRKKIVSGINTSLELKNNTFKKEKIPLKIYGNPCLASIASTDQSFNKFFININANTFTLGDNSGQQSSGSTKLDLPVTIAGQVFINSLKIKKLDFSRVQLNYFLSGNSIVINKFSTGFMNGQVFGKGRIAVGGGVPVVSTSAAFNKIKVQSLTVFSDQFKNRFFGIADGKANLKFNISDNILDTFTGNIRFSINKGKVANTGIQNGLGIWLSALKYKLKDLEFNIIYGNADINKTNYRINSFIFNSPDVKLKMKGSLNRKLITPKLSIALEFNERFTNDLPEFATQLKLRKYKQGKIYVIPFEARGDITNSSNIKMK